MLLLDRVDAQLAARGRQQGGSGGHCAIFVDEAELLDLVSAVLGQPRDEARGIRADIGFDRPVFVLFECLDLEFPLDDQA